jgi:hypothetical protein
MSWLSLITALMKLGATVAKFFSDRQLIATGKAEGRADSDRDHAQAANEAGEAMRQIADKAPDRETLLKRLDEGSA